MKLLAIGNKPDISFGMQLNLLLRGLNSRGVETKLLDHVDPLEAKIRTFNSFNPDVLLIWTFFHDIGHPTITVDEIKKITGGKRNYLLVAFEVSDTTRISDKGFFMLESMSPDIFLTPSTWASSAFKPQPFPVEVLPHALDPAISKIKNEKKLILPHVDIYPHVIFVYAQHSPDRKGFDIAENVITRLEEERTDFTTIVKTRDITKTRIKRVYPVAGGLMPELLFKHYDKASHFFYPVRGGSFEIPVLEMLALGKTVIIPEIGAWTDIPLSKDDVYWIKVKTLRRVWKDNPYHVGYMVEPDENDAYEKLKQALDSPKTVNTAEYEKQYSVEAITERFLEIIKK